MLRTLKNCWLATAVLSCCLLSGAAARAQNLSGRVVSVISGQEVRLKANDGMVYNLLIEGLGAPEQGQPMAQEAQKLLSSLVTGREVDVEVTGRIGKQLVGRFTIRLDVASQMIGSGMAFHRVDRNYGNVGLDELEQMAKGQRVGVWSVDNPVRPWEANTVGTTLEKARRSGDEGDDAVRISQSRSSLPAYLRRYLQGDLRRAYDSIGATDVDTAKRFASIFRRSLGAEFTRFTRDACGRGCGQIASCKTAVLHYEVCYQDRRALDPGRSKIPCADLCGVDLAMPSEEEFQRREAERRREEEERAEAERKASQGPPRLE